MYGQYGLLSQKPFTIQAVNSLKELPFPVIAIIPGAETGKRMAAVVLLLFITLYYTLLVLLCMDW